MAKFKMHLLDIQYNIFDNKSVNCEYNEILENARIYLKEVAEQGYSSTMQCHVSGMWPDGSKLFFIVFP